MGHYYFPVGTGGEGTLPCWEGRRCQQHPPVTAGRGNTHHHVSNVSKGWSSLPWWKPLPGFSTENSDVQRNHALALVVLLVKSMLEPRSFESNLLHRKPRLWPRCAATGSAVLDGPQKPPLGLSFAPIKT